MDQRHTKTKSFNEPTNATVFAALEIYSVQSLKPWVLDTASKNLTEECQIKLTQVFEVAIELGLRFQAWK